jgi:hypothetical protein
MIMATSSMAAVSRVNIPISGPAEGGIPVRDFLKTLAFIVGTTAFYNIFTKRTGISVGELGQVGELDHLDCPDWFLGKLLYQLGTFCQNHVNELHEEFDATDTTLSLALTATCARTMAERLAYTHAFRLVDAAVAQIDSAEKSVDFEASELNPNLLPA